MMTRLFTVMVGAILAATVHISPAPSVQSARARLAPPMLDPHVPPAVVSRLSNGVRVVAVTDQRAPIVTFKIMVGARDGTVIRPAVRESRPL